MSLSGSEAAASTMQRTSYGTRRTTKSPFTWPVSPLHVLGGECVWPCGYGGAAGRVPTGYWYIGLCPPDVIDPSVGDGEGWSEEGSAAACFPCVSVCGVSLCVHLQECAGAQCVSVETRGQLRPSCYSFELFPGHCSLPFE